MTATIVTIDPKLLPETKAEAKKSRTSLNSFVNSIIEKYLTTKKIRERKEIPNAYLKKIIKKADEDWKAGNTSPRFDNAEDFIKYLHEQSA